MSKRYALSTFLPYVVAMVGSLCSTQAAALSYSITDLGTFLQISAQDVNNSGQVVGTVYREDDHLPYAYLWQNGVMNTLSDPGYGEAINGSGQIVGTTYPYQTPFRAFIATDGVMEEIGPLNPDYPYTAAFGINDSGTVVGYKHPAAGGYSQGFIWQQGVMQDIGTLGGPGSIAGKVNNSGQVIGWSTTADSDQPNAFLYDNGMMINLGVLDDQAGYAVASDINDLGQVVGGSRVADYLMHAFSWRDGAMLDLGTIGGGCAGESYAFGNNNAGQVVGTWNTMACLGGGGYQTLDSGAFLYTDGAMLDLNSLISADSGWHLFEARAINDLGQIVGQGMLDGEVHAFLATPVPLPAAAFLFASGLIGMSWTGLRKG
ncbi:MAG: DUF3466 family protein [Thiogranum sp.]|nr:DUF3466 family protein [Thiogranum sp.]